MNNILLIDIQNGFIDESHFDMIKNLNKYLKGIQFDNVIYTRFVTNHKEKTYKNIEWFGLYDKTERKLAVRKLQQGKVFDKKCHGLTPSILKYILENQIKEINVCGINNEGSIDYICDVLEKNNVKVNLLYEFIKDGKEKDSNVPQGLAPNLFIKTINGFYMGDIFSNDKITGSTILSFAVIEWLLTTKHTTQELQTIYCYYYKLFPSKFYKYDEDLALWLKNECKNYRICDNYNGIVITSAIGHYAGNLSEVDNLVEKCLCATHNNEYVIEGAKIINYAIWLLKFSTPKKDILGKLNNFFEYTFTNDILENILLFKKDKNAINFSRLILSIFVNSSSFTNAIELGKYYKLNEYCLTCLCSIAEAYYVDIPNNLIQKCKAKLPDKFKKLLIDFGKLKNEKNI